MTPPTTPGGVHVHVGVIGAGRLGSALCAFLTSRAVPVTVVAAHRDHAWEDLASLDLVLLAVPDDALTDVAHQLASALEPIPERPTVVHHSGALTSEVLAPVARLGCPTAALHPLASVSGPASGAVLRQAPWSLQGDLSPALNTLLDQLGIHPVPLGATNKPAYHAAACLVSSHVYGLAAEASSLLTSVGLTAGQAHDAVVALLSSTIIALSDGPSAPRATGPRARGDAATIAAHRHALSTRPQTLALYDQLDAIVAHHYPTNSSSENAEETR